MHCLKVNAVGTRAQKIEASVGNSCLFCGAFISGLSHSSSCFPVRGTISKYSKLSLIPPYGHSYICSFPPKFFFLSSTCHLCHIPQLCWFCILRHLDTCWSDDRMTKKPLVPSLRKLGGRKEKCMLAALSFEVCQMQIRPPFCIFSILSFFARRHWQAVVPVSQFSLCCGWRILGMNDVGELCPKCCKGLWDFFFPGLHHAL